MELLGREAQRDLVAGLLVQVRSGVGGVLVVAGPPGSGRTAIADLAAGLGRAGGVEVLRTAQLPGRSGRWVWCQLLREVGAGELGAQLWDGVGAGILESAAAALTSSSPRLIVVDDLDVGGSEASGVLGVLADRVSACPLAVVVTASRELGVGRNTWLEPLSVSQVSMLTGEARPDVVQAIWTGAQGRPGPALVLASALEGLDDGADPVVAVALSAGSSESFLGLDTGLIRLLEIAVERRPDERSRPLLLARLAYALLGDATAAPRRRALVLEAVALARLGQRPNVLAEVLDARLHALWDPSGSLDRLDTATEIITLARAAADLERERRGLFWRFVALMELARVPEAESALAAFARAASASGDRHGEVMALSRHAMLAVLRGAFDDALRLTSRVAEQGHQVLLPDTEALVGTLRGMVIGLRDARAEPLDVDVEALRAAARATPGHFYGATVAYLLSRQGSLDEAALALERALPEVLAGAGPRWLGATAQLADVAVKVRAREAAAALLNALSPYHGGLAMFAGGNSSLGPVDHWLGVLSASLGRIDDAVEWLESAATLADRIGAWPYLAITLGELSEVLTTRGRPEDITRAKGYRQRALVLARRLGMGHLEPALTLGEHEWMLRQDDEGWDLQAGSEHARLPDGRGLHYLRALLAAPGKEVRCTDLAAGGSGLAPIAPEAVLDQQALAAYRGRLSELERALDDADERGDPDAAALAHHDRAELVDELRRATGLGARTRRISAEDERARVNVTRTLRRTLAQIAVRAPLAGAHLDASISTGRCCRYQPAVGHGPSRWRT